MGDTVHQVTPPVSGVDTFCSVGLAFDGELLYYDRCNDTNIYAIDPVTGALEATFDTGIAEDPNALAFDAKRNGLWIGAQDCNTTGMPIYFWDFDDDTVTLAFTVPPSLINPATGSAFLGICFLDGLAYNENDPSTDADDELWLSDDIDDDLGVFRPDGTLVSGHDATVVDPSLARTSGLAIGGDFLYMGNNGGGDVLRADVSSGAPVFQDQFVSGDARQEDMECDPVTFAPTHVMWVRTTPQGGSFPDVITAFEIEPNSCGLGGGFVDVSLDVRPTSCPNPVQCTARGLLPVAIEGSAGFDPSTIDPATVRLEGVAPLRWNLEDVSAPFTPLLDRTDCVEDCNTDGPDGHVDLTLKFDLPAVLQALDDGGTALVNEARVPMSVSGSLYEADGGLEIRGMDVARILCGGG